MQKQDLKKKFSEQHGFLKQLEVRLEEAKESEEFYQATSNTLSVQARTAGDEISEGRKMAADIMQALDADMTKPLIDDALQKRNRREKSKQQQRPIIGVKMVGSIDERPWSTAFKRRHESSDDWEKKMKCELSLWEALVRNPAFCPFTTVQIREDKWERRIDHQNEKLCFLKKSLGKELYNSVTTALMEIEQYNGSGRYPIPLPWIFEESRMATLKEVIAHLGYIVEAFVGAAPPAKRTRTSYKGSAKGLSPSSGDSGSTC